MRLAAEPQRKRILIVDDEPMIRDLMVVRLELAGYQAFTAPDGHEGLRRVAEVRPAALLLDINMPGLDGFDVLRDLGRTGSLARTPTLVLTARNQANDIKTAISLGARDFLTKPFRDDQLLARVARLVRRRAPRAASASRPDDDALLV